MRPWLLLLLSPMVAFAELPKYQPTPDEIRHAYTNADSLGGLATGRVLNVSINPMWYANGQRLAYRRELADGGREFVSVETATGKKTPLFDHERFATAFAKITGNKVDAKKLPLTNLSFTKDEKALRFVVRETQWQMDLTSYECSKVGPFGPTPKRNNAPDAEDEDADDLDAPQPRPKKNPGPFVPPTEFRSPDGRWLVRVREFNLFLKPTDQGDEKALTTDGTATNYYGSVAWAPDSKNFVAFRIEPGERLEVTYVESSPPQGGRAVVRSHVYPLPGDKFTAYEPWVFNVGTAKGAKVATERIDFRFPRVRWHKDGTKFTYEKTDRGHQRFRIMEVEVATAKARTLFDDQPKTFVNQYANFTLLYLDATEEIIVSSERSGWNHLYLVDAKTGTVKNAITQGEFVVRGIENLDEKARVVEFRACGKNAGQDPYFIHYYRVGLDGKNLVDLTDANGTHNIVYAPGRAHYVATHSRVDMPPIHELRQTSDGKLITTLEKADESALKDTNLAAPEVFVAKGRDGKTDIWGIVTRPRNFDPKKKYPIIEYIYAGPHDSHVPKSYRAFSARQSLAEFGFIVVQCDGMGTLNRSKAFHDVCWKNVGDAGFPDRIAWIKALATKYPYMDTTRVGIYGTSAGGQSSTGALLFHGDFYKVAVSSCGCHDNRMDKSSWNEQWMGYPVGPHYAAQSNITNAHKLTGKLLLIVGELDTNVPAESTYRLCDALIKAKKDFDFLMVPGMGHSDGGPYGERRRRDFFVRHLHGVNAPDWNVK